MAPQTATLSVEHGDLDDYGIDNFDSDPFADSDEGNANTTESNKRKADAGLGIDEAVKVAKKARAPRVKLDEVRLLSDKGIPKLRRKAGDLKFKGKGHEFSDTARLLSFYQTWLDDLFPKGKFVDALAMIEKTGHKRTMGMARMEWIEEGKPNYSRNEHGGAENEPTREAGRDIAKFPARVAPIFENSGRISERPKSPGLDELFRDEDDIYGATPRNTKKVEEFAAVSAPEDDEDEDLDALMAEEEAHRTTSTSLFGNGLVARAPTEQHISHEEDELDALMAEAEAERNSRADRLVSGLSRPLPPLSKNVRGDEVDALTDEAEAQISLLRGKASSPPKQNLAPRASGNRFDSDEEEAMAEMDGLW